MDAFSGENCPGGVSGRLAAAAPSSSAAFAAADTVKDRPDLQYMSAGQEHGMSQHLPRAHWG
jgi:hypothetical protein